MANERQNARLRLLAIVLLCVLALCWPYAEPPPPTLEFVRMQQSPEKSRFGFGYEWRATFRLSNTTGRAITYDGEHRVVNANDEKEVVGSHLGMVATYFRENVVLKDGESVEFDCYVREPGKPWKVKMEYWNGKSRKVDLPKCMSWVPIQFYDWYQRDLSLEVPRKLVSKSVSIQRPKATYKAVELPPEPEDETNGVRILRFTLKEVFE
jgi:hypothetical protein